MSGGGKKSTKKTDTPAATTTPVQTVQPGMPGQIDALSQQLAAGFGQQPADLMTQLAQYYQPMSLPNYAPPAPVTPAPTPAPAPTPTPKPVPPKPVVAGNSNKSGARGGLGDRTWGR